jgi:hypothetical protein
MSLTPLLDARLKSALCLTDKLGRAPTLNELRADWGVSRARTRAVVERITLSGIELGITPTPRGGYPLKQEERKIQLETLIKHLGRTPTLKELARYWGISSTRAKSVLIRISKR